MTNATPPQDLAAERGVLGGCLVNGPEVVAQAVDQVEVEHFYDRRHRSIFSAIVLLWDQGDPVDEITVTSLLSDQQQLEMVGGAAYLAELADILLGPEHVAHYASLVREKAKLRDMAKAAHRILELVHGNGADAETVLEEAQQQINQAAASAAGGTDLVVVSQAMETTLEEFEQRQTMKRNPNAVPTGFQALDNFLGGGLWPGKVYLIGGRPSMGKTAFAINLAGHNALDLKNTALYGSTEEISEDMTGRLICSRLRIDTEQWTQGRVPAKQANAVRQFRSRLEGVPLYWFCRGGLPVQPLMAKAKALWAASSLSLVVFDFIQQGERGERTEHEEITRMSRALKRLAMDLKIPVVILSQLNRSLEKRDNKRPILPDLRGSGTLEEDAHVILFLYRPVEYDISADPRICEVGVAKNKMGRKGKLYLSFFAEYTRFEDRGGDPSPQGEMYGQSHA